MDVEIGNVLGNGNGSGNGKGSGMEMSEESASRGRRDRKRFWERDHFPLLSPPIFGPISAVCPPINKCILTCLVRRFACSSISFHNHQSQGFWFDSTTS